MLRWTLFLSLTACAFLLPILVGSAECGSLDYVVVALHLQGRTAEGICESPTEGGWAPYFFAPRFYEVSGEVGDSYNAYLIVVGSGFSIGEGEVGVAGLSCGIDYNPVISQGVDILDWTFCGDLEFPNAGPNGVWPAAGGGNRIIYDITQPCPTQSVPGFDLPVTIFGAFYVYAYGDDDLRITRNMNVVSGPELTVGDCVGAETDLPTTAGGWIAFSLDGLTPGCNPVLGPCEDFAPPPQCQVSVDTLTFGSVPLGTSLDRTFTITNIGGFTLLGTVSAGCGDFTVTENAGAFGLGDNQTRTISVRYAPTTETTTVCVLTLGSNCADVYCTGTGLPEPDPMCTVSVSTLDFGGVEVGSHLDRSFTITNTGGGILAGNVASACGEFAVTVGAGAYALGAGQSDTVTVRFSPTMDGPASCALDLGSLCADMPCSGSGVPRPDCVLSTETLSFGLVHVGEAGDESFTLTNMTASPLTVTVSEACPNFTVLIGGGTVTLEPGIPHEVWIRFSPMAITTYQCTIQIDGACNDITASGEGEYSGVGGGSQTNAVVALHSSTHNVKGVDPCLEDPVTLSIPCENFDVQQLLNYSTDLYLVVANGDVDPGIGALSCGILYNNEDIGGWTMGDGVGVDVYSWTFCASGLEFPNGPTGLAADEWPASGGGIRRTWEVINDCQRTVLGNHGVHAVAGSFYVYAYGSDVFHITANNNLLSGPEFQVGDCDNSVSDLPLTHAARVGFGGTMGYNPCSEEDPLPVRLLSFTADRDADGAVLRWKTGAATADHLGFEVHRQTAAAGRELISDGLLSGRSDYAFSDPAPPLGEAEYWLAERSREGSITWHGPAILPAAAVTGGRLVMTQPPANPFVTFTTFSFRLPQAGEVRVSIYDTMGREVARPFSGTLSPGEQVVSWDGRDDRGRRLSAGAYIYRIDTENGSLSGKVVRLQ